MEKINDYEKLRIKEKIEALNDERDELEKRITSIDYEIKTIQSNCPHEYTYYQRVYGGMGVGFNVYVCQICGHETYFF
jgi:transposase-like protein